MRNLSLAAVNNGGAIPSTQYHFVVIANSLGYGTPFPPSSHVDWPYVLFHRAAFLNAGVTYVNAGVPGRSTGTMITQVQTYLDLIEPGKINIAWVQEITNDGIVDLRSPAEMAANMSTLCGLLRSGNGGVGFDKIVVVTANKITPLNAQSANVDSANALVLAAAANYADATIDYSQISLLSDPDNTTVRQSDKLHYTVYGYELFADANESTALSMMQN